MTRETKIGLLVGLAFIIVIGILLSDHLTSSTEPPPAQLASTGSNVRNQVTTPGGTLNAAPVVVAPQVQPQRTVPTPRDLQQQTPANEVVQVRVGGGSLNQTQNQPQAAPIVIVPPTKPQIEFVPDPKPSRAIPVAQPDQQVAGADVPGGIGAIAKENGEPLISITPTQQPATAVNVQEYVAQPGDNLSRIAAKVMGSSSKANQDAIVAVNPSLSQDRNKIIAGKTYRVPTAGTSSSAPVAQQAQPIAAVQKASQTLAAHEVWYTVKDGDTLTRIATDELGDLKAIAAIIELNRDILPDPNLLKPNMKIRLPAKPLASAS